MFYKKRAQFVQLVVFVDQKVFFVIQEVIFVLSIYRTQGLGKS